MENYTYITSNEKHDFYIRKIDNKDWYCYAFNKGTTERAAMAGSTTKKAVIEIVNAWAGWMK